MCQLYNSYQKFIAFPRQTPAAVQLLCSPSFEYNPDWNRIDRISQGHPIINLHLNIR